MIYLRGAPGVATTKIMFSLYENADHDVAITTQRNERFLQK